MSDGAVIDSGNRTCLVGAHALEGRAPGNYCTVTMADRVTVDVGVDGEGVFRINGNRSGSAQIALMASSNSNDVLSAVEAAGLPFPFTLIELGGSRSKLVAPRAMITKVADLIWSDGSEVRLWTIVWTRANVFVGGMAPGQLNQEIGAPG